MDPGSRSGHVDDLATEVAGEGADLLLIHEGIGDSRSWDSVWAALTARFRTIRYDARGFGASPDPAAPYSRGADAAAVLDAAGARRAAVIGVSMGADTAIELALERPERVERLVLVSAAPDGAELPEGLVARWEEVDRLVEHGQIDAANEIEVKMWVDGVGRETASVDPDVRTSVAEVNRELLIRQSRFTAEPRALDPPPLARLDELRGVPTLVVHGAFDQPLVHAASRELAARAGAAVKEIPGAAHVPHVERPEEFTRAVLGFLEASA